MTQTIQGYAEGYYGQLLSWSQRDRLLDTLRANGQDTYYYAPKEDACHRLHWRQPYGVQWRDNFRSFCNAARQKGIRVVAGVAPGLDFEFSHLNGGPDLQILLSRYRQLVDDGADRLSLLMDDIDAVFHVRNPAIRSEGQAHAQLANVVGEFIDQSIWVTPRIYANELAGSSPDYLPDFLAALDERHEVLYCGSDIVARQASAQAIRQVAPPSRHPLIVWDNLYANDYCPRRLFLGPWLGREAAPRVLLNPTGMVHTDCLLLDLMATGTTSTTTAAVDWQGVMARHGVPDTFQCIARYCWHPVFNDESYELPQAASAAESTEQIKAIDDCLWRWKSPLSREWYPFLFGLKLDLLLQNGSMSVMRTRKTQNAPLVARLQAGHADDQSGKARV